MNCYIPFLDWPAYSFPTPASSFDIMAHGTRSKGKTVAETLLESDPSSLSFRLHGPVPANTFSNLNRLALYLGLETAQAVSEWLESHAFKPHFEELYTDWIQPQIELAASTNKPRKQGPTLPNVQAAITDGEEFGDEKYSGYRVRKDDFSEIGHYALCLFRLRKANTEGWDGAFRGRSMTKSDVETRLW
jgi:hypothetical protein